MSLAEALLVSSSSSSFVVVVVVSLLLSVVLDAVEGAGLGDVSSVIALALALASAVAGALTALGDPIVAINFENPNSIIWKFIERECREYLKIRCGH
jgi:Na+/H+ antiporter NhaD/arsenite permease-like protein